MPVNQTLDNLKPSDEITLQFSNGSVLIQDTEILLESPEVHVSMNAAGVPFLRFIVHRDKATAVIEAWQHYIHTLSTISSKYPRSEYIPAMSSLLASQTESGSYEDDLEEASYGDDPQPMVEMSYGDDLEEGLYGDDPQPMEEMSYGDDLEEASYGDDPQPMEEISYGDDLEEASYGDDPQPMEEISYGDDMEEASYGDDPQPMEEMSYGDDLEEGSYEGVEYDSGSSESPNPVTDDSEQASMTIRGQNESSERRILNIQGIENVDMDQDDQDTSAAKIIVRLISGVAIPQLLWLVDSEGS